MTKVIHTDKAPAAIGPYVQAVDLGNLVLTSGQIPVNPTTGEVPKEIVAQARQSLENIKAIVEQAGLSVAHIVKTTVFVKDLTILLQLMQNMNVFSKKIITRASRHVLAWKLLVCQKTLVWKLKRSL